MSVSKQHNLQSDSFSYCPDTHTYEKPARSTKRATGDLKGTFLGSGPTRIPPNHKFEGNNEQDTTDWPNLRRRAEALASHDNLGKFTPSEIGRLGVYQVRGLFESTGSGIDPQNRAVPWPAEYQRWNVGDINRYTADLESYVNHRDGDYSWFRPEATIGLSQSINNKLKFINGARTKSKGGLKYTDLRDCKRDLLFYEFHANQQKVDESLSQIVERAFDAIERRVDSCVGDAKEKGEGFDEWTEALNRLKQVKTRYDNLSIHTLPISQVDEWTRRNQECYTALSKKGYDEEDMKKMTKSIIDANLFPITRVPIKEVEEYRAAKSSSSVDASAKTEPIALVEAGTEQRGGTPASSSSTTIFGIPKSEMMRIDNRRKAQTSMQSLTDNLNYTPNITSKKPPEAKGVMQMGLTLYSDAKIAKEGFIQDCKRSYGLTQASGHEVISDVEARMKKDKSRSTCDAANREADNLRRSWGEQTHGLNDYKSICQSTHESLIAKMQEKERELKCYGSDGSTATEELREIFLKQVSADQERIHAMFAIARDFPDDESRKKAIKGYQDSASNQISGARKAFKALTEQDPSLEGVRTWEDYLSRNSQSARTDANHAMASAEETVGSKEEPLGSKGRRPSLDQITESLGLKPMPASWADLFNE